MPDTQSRQNAGKKTSMFQEFSISIIDILKESGGSCSATEVIDHVIEKMSIPEQELEKTTQSGRSYIKNQIYWASFRLMEMDFLDFSKKGVWNLTEKGRRVRFGPDHAQDEKQSQDYKTELLAILKSLPPDGFEQILLRLLRESRVVNIALTQRYEDGAFEGHGILQVNPLLSYNVLFICQRSEDSVKASQIRKCRGDMTGKADKGIIITTGHFTLDSKKEAHTYGAPPIELVDGTRLVDMFESLKLGLKPQKTYIVDNRFFDDFR